MPTVLTRMEISNQRLDWLADEAGFIEPVSPCNLWKGRVILANCKDGAVLSRLIREWHGRTHTVTVTEDGFECAGTTYPSLTEVAKKITGAHWSGPRFFGLVRAGTSSRKGTANA